MTTPAWSAVPLTVKLLPSEVIGRLLGSVNQSLTSGAGVEVVGSDVVGSEVVVSDVIGHPLEDASARQLTGP